MGKSLCGARLFVPSTMNEALSYQEKQEFMWKYIQELEERVKALEEKVNSENNIKKSLEGIFKNDKDNFDGFATDNKNVIKHNKNSFILVFKLLLFSINFPISLIFFFDSISIIGILSNLLLCSLLLHGKSPPVG